MRGSRGRGDVAEALLYRLGGEDGTLDVAGSGVEVSADATLRPASLLFSPSLFPSSSGQESLRYDCVAGLAMPSRRVCAWLAVLHDRPCAREPHQGCHPEFLVVLKISSKR